MIIRDDFLPVNPFSRPGHKLIKIKAIIIHWVGKSRQTADAVQKYFLSLSNQTALDTIPDVYASAHYAINGKEIVHMIPDDEVAYHVGAWGYTPEAMDIFGAEGTSNLPQRGSTPNWYTLGIELNHINDEGQFSGETWDSAVQLAAKLCREYNVDCLRHFDVTGKLCPKWFVMHGLEWDMFLNDVWEGL